MSQGTGRYGSDDVANDSLEAHSFAQPRRLDGVIATVVMGLGLLAAASLGRCLMEPMTAPPASSVAAPPPIATSVEPVPPPAAPPSDAAPEAAVPAPPPIAAATSQPRARAAAKRRPPVERSAPPEVPPTSEPEAPAAPVEPAEEAAPGTLRINSLPWAHVFLDGRLLGNTPLRGVSVAAGKHSLRLVNPRFSMVKTSEIDVPTGEELRLVEMLDD